MPMAMELMWFLAFPFIPSILRLSHFLLLRWIIILLKYFRWIIWILRTRTHCTSNTLSAMRKSKSRILFLVFFLFSPEFHQFFRLSLIVRSTAPHTKWNDKKIKTSSAIFSVFRLFLFFFLHSFFSISFRLLYEILSSWRIISVLEYIFSFLRQPKYCEMLKKNICHTYGKRIEKGWRTSKTMTARNTVKTDAWVFFTEEKEEEKKSTNSTFENWVGRWRRPKIYL